MPVTTNDACELYYEEFGSADDPTLLMINGLGSQCINYQEEWCERFVGRGFHVVRFDNRDVGLSSSYDDAPTGPQGEAYTVWDMAADALAVIDAVRAERAHVMGLSMGGMIAQALAIHHPDRLASMTSVMSSTGESEYGRPTPEAWQHLTRPPAVDRESYVEGHIAGLRIWGTPEWADEERWRADAERAFDRSFRPSGTRRQFLAIQASGSRSEALQSVQVPALVIHGDRDSLIDISGGRRTAELIPGARFEVIEGMGHDHPPALWDRWVNLVGDVALGT